MNATAGKLRVAVSRSVGCKCYYCAAWGTYHRIIQSLELEGTFRGHLVQLPCNRKFKLGSLLLLRFPAQLLGQPRAEALRKRDLGRKSPPSPRYSSARSVPALLPLPAPSPFSLHWDSRLCHLLVGSTTSSTCQLYTVTLKLYKNSQLSYQTYSFLSPTNSFWGLR